MKTIGVVGGVAWPSTIVYYRTINELVAQRLGGDGLHCARLVLAQTDFEEVERRQREGRWDLVGELLAAEGGKVKAAGADFFLLACNTVHSADQIIESAVDLRSCTSSTRPLDRRGLSHGRTARQPLHDARHLLRPSAGATLRIDSAHRRG